MADGLNRHFARLTSTSWRLHLTGIVLGCLVGVALYYGTTAFFMHEAEGRILDLLLQNRALHQYIQRDTHPALYAMNAEGVIDSEFYSAELLSSSYMARHVTQYLNEERRLHGLPAVIYRIAAVNPRNPVNAAGDADRKLIDLFNADRERTSYREVISTDSGKYLQVSLPFLETGDACLRCHGNPDAAPQGLVNKYGTTAGFNTESGRIRAIETIQAPLSSDLLQARILFLAMFVALVSTCFLILIVSSLRRKVRRHTAQLAASESKYRTLVEDLPCFVCTFLPDSTVTYVNKLLADYFGMTAKDMIGRKFIEIVRPQIWEKAVSLYSRVTPESPIAVDELCVVRSDGSESWQHWIFRGIFNARGEVVAYQAYAEVVTERRLAEQAVRQSEARFATVFRASPAGISITRFDDGRFVDVNEAFLKIYGYSREEVIGHTSLELNLYDPATDRERLVRMLIEDGGAREIEGRARRKTGDTCEILLSAELIQLEGAPHILATVQDITERKRAEEAVRDSQARFSKIFHASPIAISISRIEDGRFVDVNDAFVRMLGYSRGELIGHSSQELNLYSDYVDRSKLLAHLHAVGSLRDHEYRIRHKSGAIKTLLMSIETIQLNGEPYMLVSAQDISERKQAEAALQKSEERNRALLNAIPDNILLLDSNGDLIDFHGGSSGPEFPVRQVFGSTLDEVPMTSEVREEVRAGITEVLATGLPRVYEHDLQTAQGRKVVEARFVKCSDTTVLLLLRNVTDRKQAEEALRKSETVMRGIFDSAPVGIIFVAPDRTMLNANAALCSLSGYKVEELIGQSAGILYMSEEEYEEAGRNLYEQMKKYGVGVQEKRMRHKDGHPVFVILRLSSCDPDDPSAGVIATIIDITERRKTEEALRQSEVRYRSYVNHAPHAVVVVDGQGRFVEVNQTAEAMTGYRRQELLELSMHDLLTTDTDAAVRDAMTRWDTGSIRRGEVEVRRKNGSRAWWSVDGVRLSEDRYLSFCVDITENRRLRELESRAQRLETAGRIAGQVAHDFNNLLAPLTAYPDMIREELPDDHPALTFLRSIEESAQQIADINQQLLTLGRRGHYNQEPLNLNDVVNHVLAQMEAPPETLAVDVHEADDLMPMTGGQSQIHRVLVNLVQNAREAMQDNGRLTLTTENVYIDEPTTAHGHVPKGEYVRLSLSDTGCGIPPDIVAKVFDPFFTTKKADRRRGSGLGLSVVDAVVHDHRGHVELTSEVGTGTTVRLYFPITREPIAEPKAETVRGGNERILLVDDDPTQREVCLHILHRLGYSAEAAAGGEEALRWLRVKSFDLVILDMIMPPGIDGAETYRHVLEINPGQRAIMLSGFAESDRVIEAQQMGAGAFLRKPVTRATLALAVRHELDRTAANSPGVQSTTATPTPI